MLIFPPQRQYHHNLQWTDGLTILAIGIGTVAILVHCQPSYNTSHTMKPTLFNDVTRDSIANNFVIGVYCRCP